MKVKIKKCSVPGAWYENRIGQDIEVEYVNLRPDGVPEWFTAKTWNWFWKRNDLQKIRREDCDVIDASGSLMADGYELGKAHGKVLKEQELIKEGILTDEPDDDDEEVTLTL